MPLCLLAILIVMDIIRTFRIVLLSQQFPRQFPFEISLDLFEGWWLIVVSLWLPNSCFLPFYFLLAAIFILDVT